MAHRFRTFTNSHHNTMMRRSEQGRRPQSTKPGWATWRHASGCSCPLCNRAREATAQLQGRSPSAAPHSGGQRGVSSAPRPQETRRRERSPPPRSQSPPPQSRQQPQQQQRRQEQQDQRYREQQHHDMRSRNYPRPCAPATLPGTSNSIVFVDPCSPCSDGGGSEIDNPERLLSTRWQNFETTSEDANFTITRVFTARFAVLHDTMLFRLHIKGKLASTDLSITLTLPRHAHAAANGNDHQFCVALISSPDSLMFAPVTITPGSNLLTINQQSLRSDTVYEIWVQSFVEVRRD